MTNDEYDLMRKLFKRYAKMIEDNLGYISCVGNKTEPEHLLKLCQEVIENGQKYPFDKMNRWLGFVQGVLAVYGVIDVRREQNYTRPLFHKLYGKVAPSF